MQRRSTGLREVEQLSLIPDRKIVSLPVSLSHIRILTSTKAALDYACQLANVVPKEIYSQMECDKATWSRICSGEWDLDGRDIPKFNRIVGNSAYLRYLDHLDGVDLDSIRPARDNKDRRIAELEQRVADQDRAMRMWVEAQKGGRP